MNENITSFKKELKKFGLLNTYMRMSNAINNCIEIFFDPNKDMDIVDELAKKYGLHVIYEKTNAESFAEKLKDRQGPFVKYNERISLFGTYGSDSYDIIVDGRKIYYKDQEHFSFTNIKIYNEIFAANEVIKIANLLKFNKFEKYYRLGEVFKI